MHKAISYPAYSINNEGYEILTAKNFALFRANRIS